MVPSRSIELRDLLRDWLTVQGSNYKRADLAKAIGITPRHLNNVLQGKRNLSAQAETRALAELDLVRLGGPALRRWLQARGMRIGEFAARVGKTPRTVEYWAYGNRSPSETNRALIFAITGLPQFAPSSQKGMGRDTKKIGSDLASHADEMTQADGAATIFYRLIRELQSLSTHSKAERDRFRWRVSGADIGYVRSLLAALLDEEKLEDWRRMNSYRPKEAGL